MIIGENNMVYPLDRTHMSSYPSILTPPSSSEDSPQPVYFVASPTSSSFNGPEGYISPTSFILPEAETTVNPYSLMETQPGAYLQLVEQPTDRFRFRYKSEMAGTHGSLTGMNSDKSRKQSYPTVELRNCTQPALLRCSIYQSNAVGKDFMPHAHRLIMKKGKEEQDDPHDLDVGPENGYRAVFLGMGIIHTAKKNLVSELVRKKVQLKKECIARLEGKYRELTTKEIVEIKGLAESESKSINLNIVCLRFDAFIKQNGILYPICEPIYSHGINNLKSALTGDLKIVRLDHCVSPAKGNKEIFILVERVTKKNIKIRFYETDDEDRVVWEDYGKFNDLDVHHQYAIVFKTPKYHDQNITGPVNVFIELVRPTDNARSEPRDFRYIPNKQPYKPGQKRPRYDFSSSSFDSSNVDSEELPAVINDLRIGNTNNAITSSLNVPSGLSEELVKAMQNINSDEFKKLFAENFEEYSSILMSTDAPKHFNEGRQSFGKRYPGTPYSKKLGSNLLPDIIESQGPLPTVQVAIKMEISKEEKQMAERHVKELRSFLKTTQKAHKAVEILNYYFGENKKTNALHISICQKDDESAMFLLKIMAYYRQFELIQKENADNRTALHLAVLCHNELLVKSLLMCRAKVASLDGDLNTALHLAIEGNASKGILDMLLTNRECECIIDYVDMTNIAGDTPLVIAIEKKNLLAINLLCKRHADVNKTHSKSGFVPLRFAIEKQYIEAVKHLLSLPQLDATIRDFTNVSPLSVALQKESSKEIMDIVQKYMNDRGIVVDIKEEVEEESDEEMDIEEEDIKPDIPLDELEKLYEECSNFAPQCLEEISTLLDISENWGSLSQLLEVDHLISSGLIRSEGSMSKALLIYCVETNHDSLWMIRNFLENLDETRAVEIMDRMVRESKSC